MVSEFLKRSVERARLAQETQDAAVISQMQVSDPGDLITKMHEVMAAPVRNDIETLPRDTIIKMLVDVPLEEKFTFKTELGGGGNYVQAMRQVLSRVRKKAAKSKMELEEFKLFEIAIESKDGYDEVTLIRSATMTTKEESVYEDLMNKLRIDLKPKK